MPKKIRELKAMLRRAGFTEQPGKGSHVNYWHAAVPGIMVTLSGKDGADARRYQENQVAKEIERVRRALESGSNQ